MILLSLLSSAALVLSLVSAVQAAAAHSGMVASAHPLASAVGVETLKKGGNAVDAAVATAFALGVVEPHASGIGGGGFILIYTAKNKTITSIDYRETAPRKAGPKMYASSEETKEGHAAVAVPGTVAGLAMALDRFGTMDLKKVMQAAIDIAENGFEVTQLLGHMIENNAGKLSKFPSAKYIYLREGRAFKAGERLAMKELAKTYRLIAEQGTDVFYKGVLAEAIVNEMESSGKGLISREDLAGYQPVVRRPVEGQYRGYSIYSMGPPSSGGTHVIEILNILEGYDISRSGLNRPETIRLMAEAMKSVFADREKFMGDPDFVKVPLENLLSKEHAAKLRKENGNPGAKPTRPEPVQTTHLSVVDKEGNLVSLTQTINSFFGSGLVVPGTGILLNNEMNDFVLQPGHMNSIEPGKRPLSSMSPTLVLKDGNPFMTIGMPGATRIITVLPQILMNVIDHRLTIQEAINAPRVHCMSEQEIFMESRIPQKVRDELIRNGYKLTIKSDFDLYFGGAQGVMIDPKTGALVGGADPRREGAVAGY